MNRVDLNAPHSIPHFIGSWNIEPLSLCDELINFFEAHQDNQTQGQTAEGLNAESKNSTDLTIRPCDLELPDHKPIHDYIDALYACYQDYLEQWPFLKSIIPRVEISSFNIQRYNPGEHFMAVHSERINLGTAHRVLAWMSYLNDVDDGGSTHFVHQNLDVQPQQGKTLIWPAEWTHAHRGNVVNSGVKYIVTGWIHFPVDH